MARITPTSNGQNVTLEDDQPYVGTLNNIAVDPAHNLPDGKAVGPQLIVDWELSDSSTVRDWIGFSIGINNKGVPSKLRQLCNALSERPALDEVSFFDDETYEWGYQGADGPADNQLQLGMPVTFVGTTKAKKTGGTRYGIDKYKRVTPSAAAGRPSPPEAAAYKYQQVKQSAKPRVVQPVADDFEPDEEDPPF